MGSLLKIDLSNSVSSYDKTKVTTFGRIQQQTIEGQNVVGGPLSRFQDVFTDTTQAPVGPIWVSPNNRIFVLIVTAAAAAQVACYDFDPVTGAMTYVGRIAFALPNLAATTHTFRGIRVANDASNTLSNWRLYAVTVGTVLVNGGVFCVNKIGKANFTQVLGPTLPLATATDQQAVYHLQNPLLMGALNTDTACAALALEQSTGRLYVHHGISATHQYICYDTNVASLVYNTAAVTVSVASPGKVSYTSHPYAVGDMVTFLSGTLPTGLALNTVYFVKNPSANDFEVSATLAGASINTTGSPGSATIGRAFGQTGSGWLFRTGNLPALAGTLLLTDTENNPVPINAPLNGNLLNGNSCISMLTTTNAYLGTLSELPANAAATVSVSVASPGVVTYPSHPYVANDAVVFSAGTLPTGLAVNTVYYVRNPGLNTFEVSLTSGGVSINTTGTAGVALISKSVLSWTSLTTSNLLGSSNEVTAVTATMGDWDNVLDGFVILTNTTKFLAKQVVNNVLRFKFGVINNDYYELLTDPRIQFGLAAVGGMTRKSGWLFATGTTIGQRGIITLDMSVDDYYGAAYVTTPVVNLNGVTLKSYSHYWKLYENTGDTKIYYRTTGFNSPTGNWQGPISRAESPNVTITGEVQFKIGFVVQSESYSSSPLLYALNIGFDADYATSPSWEYSHDNSSTGVPTRVGFRLKTPYATSVPTMHFRAYDLSNSLLSHFTTAANPEMFEYSTDSGVTWLPLGTIPNVAGTLVRFTFVSPPGVAIRPGLQEV